MCKALFAQARLSQSKVMEEEAGAELVEFALSAALVLMMIFGIMDCSRALYSYHYCAQMAREATRYASVRGSTWAATSCTTTTTYACMATAANVQSFVFSITPLGFSAANLSVSTSWPGITATGAACSASNVNNTPGCIVKVAVAYNFSYALPFLPVAPLALSSISNVTIAQ